MFPYARERFTPDEEALLRPHFTNLDRPVFALVNLPEVVKGALFARYSRSSKSLRRLFLDEFAGDVEVGTGSGHIPSAAEALYERVFLDYGDDSIAQLGGVHLACEQASNLLTKVLERGRLAAYLEQSTRYVPYDARLPNGRYRYYRDRAVVGSAQGARYVADMDRAFDRYAELLPRLLAHLGQVYERPLGTSELAWRRSLRAQALDSLRGILPAATLSNLGIFASGQSYEHLLLAMRAHPLPEAGEYAAMILEELRQVIPSFVARVDRPERGGAWTEYLVATKERAAEVAGELLSGEPRSQGESPRVSLVSHDPDGESQVIAAILYENGTLDATRALEVARSLDAEERNRLLGAYVGQRTNRRHRPGRAFEATEYLFDVVCDYGAFRDLQRHRLCSIEWQPLTPDLGYEIPGSVVEAGMQEEFDEAMDRAGGLYEALQPDFPHQAAYALGLAWRIRFSIRMNAREAMHLIELRSAPQGHPSYRVVAQQMHRLIADQAGHQAIARAMRWTDYSSSGLARLASERRNEARNARADGDHSEEVLPHAEQPYPA